MVGDIGSPNRTLTFPHDLVFAGASDIDRPYKKFHLGAGDEMAALRHSDRPEEKLARDIVTLGSKQIESVPHARFDKLLSADYSEIEAFRSIANLFRKYLEETDIDKPISIAVFGPPGAGKSFAIKAIAKSIGSEVLKAQEFNIAEWRGPEDLTGALHLARDIRLSGAVPLVFFDEFDATVDGNDLFWLKSFLAPMQDGTFKDDSRQHHIGRAIFVFAGGTAKCFQNFEKYSKDSNKKALEDDNADTGEQVETQQDRTEQAIGYSEDFKALKGPDFISRLSGFVDIKGINPPQPKDLNKGYMLRRAIILRSHLEKYKSLLNHEGELSIDETVLKAFLETDRFNHGPRSLEAIVRMSSLNKDSFHFAQAALPSDEQLSLHVNTADFLKHLPGRQKQSDVGTAAKSGEQ